MTEGEKDKSPLSQSAKDGDIPKELKEEFEMASKLVHKTEGANSAVSTDELIDFSKFEKNLKVKSQSYDGVRPIAVKDIVGSLGRYSGFNSQFLPKSDATIDKAKSVRTLKEHNSSFPPIKVYQVSDKYFVIDGHHRVMVSLEREKEFIDAEIIKVNFEFELNSEKEYSFNSDAAKKLLIRFEKEAFEKKTSLHSDMLAKPILVTEVSAYTKLYEIILGQHEAINSTSEDDTPLVYSAINWYRKDFLPTIEIILNEHILSMFPSRTYTDLYVWIHTHRSYLSAKTGEDIDLNKGKDDFMKTFAGDYFFKTIPERVKGYLKFLTGTKDGEND